MSEIEFTKEEKDILVQKIKGYFVDELDQEIAQFDAEFLLDFFTREVGHIIIMPACMTQKPW